MRRVHQRDAAAVRRYMRDYVLLQQPRPRVPTRVLGYVGLGLWHVGVSISRKHDAEWKRHSDYGVGRRLINPRERVGAPLRRKCALKAT